MTEREWAYTAGIIDGEGCISIGRRTKNRRYPIWSLSVLVANTDLRLLTWLRERLGGNLVTKKAPLPEQNWKQQYQLQWTGDVARSILVAIEQDVVVKRAQLLLGLEFYAATLARISRHRYAPEEREHLERLYNAMRHLNTRGRGRFVDTERLSEPGPRVAAWNMR